MSAEVTEAPVEMLDATVELPGPVALGVHHPPTIRPKPARARRARRLRRPSADALLALGLTAIVLVFQAWNITGFPSASDDEGTYLAQAWAVQHGLGLAHYTYWYDHPPLGWIQLALLSWLPDAAAPNLLAVAAGRLAMLPVAAVSGLLVYGLARRLGMARWAAALALLAYGLSPLSLTMTRQIYLDSFAVMWILAAFVLALSPRKHLWHHAGAGAAAAMAVLSKETMLLMVPAVVVALWQSTARTTVRPWAIGAFLSALALMGVFYPLYAALKGELFPGSDHVSLVAAWQFQLMHRTGSGSVFVAGSGSNVLLKAWLYYDVVLLVGGSAAIALALAVRRLRAPAIGAALLVLIALRPGGYLPAMYVVQLLPLFALLLAGVLEIGATWLLAKRFGKSWLDRRWLRWTALAVAVVAAATFVLPRWYVGDRRALTADDNAGYRAAAVWLRTEVPQRASTTVVVDDVLWLDLVHAGYRSERVIWFYKLDLDSAVAARLPAGWRDVDYIVSTPAIRQDPGSLPTVAALLAHSTVVVTFGADQGRIEIRRVNKERT